MKTSTGTRWPVFARVEVFSGLFAGAVYDRVPIFAPPLKAQLLEKGSVEGRLGRGAAKEYTGPQWHVKEMPVQG
jgi:hypothetical protein